MPPFSLRFMKLFPIVLAAASLLWPVSSDAAGARPSTRDRLVADGYSTVAGPTFSIHIKLMEAKPRNFGKDKILYVWDAQITDNKTGKRLPSHGRLESSHSDMHMPIRWQFRDMNGDGFIDYRYDKGEIGSPYWWTWLWQPERKHGGFTFSSKYSGPTS